ncbi:MAG: arsenic resistance N-acetyltransferase ArsN2 [Gammaproteobacteria bacterium]|nr:arsenic resistance N-acetyltransferase ArsN2 [Gammaproteobacteria bacterium]MDH3749003.1 arsenic resistance N-acetyltransferase ArsN2 [Gammaproteobacteria bacterium]MDH3804469.1 arsenic resistance N-acetyltransferase ArsN2 [Gammaproteobacteria bacterium]
MSSDTAIRPATDSDLSAAQSWLAGASLPVDDLTTDHMQNFLVALTNDRPVGVIGLEQFGKVGLLRSLVVDPTLRNGGIGRQLVAALETRAAESGVSELWLLTIDADRYFSRLAYVVVDRNDAPEAIRNTDEFSKLCPGDAVLMWKRL